MAKTQFHVFFLKDILHFLLFFFSEKFAQNCYSQGLLLEIFWKSPKKFKNSQNDIRQNAFLKSKSPKSFEKCCKTKYKWRSNFFSIQEIVPCIFELLKKFFKLQKSDKVGIW